MRVGRATVVWCLVPNANVNAGLVFTTCFHHNDK